MIESKVLPMPISDDQVNTLEELKGEMLKNLSHLPVKINQSETKSAAPYLEGLLRKPKQPVAIITIAVYKDENGISVTRATFGKLRFIEAVGVLEAEKNSLLHSYFHRPLRSKKK